MFLGVFAAVVIDRGFGAAAKSIAVVGGGGLTSQALSDLLAWKDARGAQRMPMDRTSSDRVDCAASFYLGSVATPAHAAQL